MCVLTFHPTPSHLLILTMYPLCRYLPPHGIGLLYSFRFETECDIYPALFCWNIFLGLGTLLLVLICNFLPLSTVVGRQRRELKTGHLRPISKYVGRWCLERACNGMVLSPPNVGAPFFSSPYLSVICIHFRTTEFVPSFGRFAVATVPSQPPSLLLRHRLLTSLLLLLPTDSGGGGNSNECCAVAPLTTSTTGNIHFKLEKNKIFIFGRRCSISSTGSISSRPLD